MKAIKVLDNRKQMTQRVSILPKKQIVILLKEYSNFTDIFNKMNADIFLKHSIYDLAIETEKGKISFFGPVYNYLGVELQTLQNYINKILAKSFITPFKFFLEHLCSLLRKKIMVYAYVSIIQTLI